MSGLTPFEALGGADGVRALVNRFYDLVETAPEAAALRRIHGPSLESAREKLTLYLTGWTGGADAGSTSERAAIAVPMRGASRHGLLNQQLARVFVIRRSAALRSGSDRPCKLQGRAERALRELQTSVRRECRAGAGPRRCAP